MSKQRITILGVPVDIVQPEDLEMEVLELLSKPGTKQIIFLSVWDLLKARRKGDFKNCVENAGLILPVSKSILKGASFLKKEVPVRYNPFDAVISIMSVLDSHYKSIYLFGSRSQTLHIAEKNVHDTFPTLRIVGRYPGFYQKTMEENIVQSIYKSSPSLVLLSEGIKDKNCWAYKRRNQFSSSIFLYYRDAMGIFSKRVKRISEVTFRRGHEIYHEVVRNPLKLFLLIPFLRYNFLLIWYRAFKKV
ncbi:MAG: WecB/TagA/CpsF family glycosyltransferase [Treponema sp.]|nr:WecB/TagA/CpsF family glycosyltransferase [Treponema sp.]